MENFSSGPYQAIISGHKDLVFSLVTRGLDIEFRDSLGRTAFVTACEWNRTEIALFLLKKGAKPNVRCKDNTTPFWWACRQGNTDLVVKLLGASRDLISLENTRGVTPLAVSVAGKHLEVARILLINGAEESLEARGAGVTPLLLTAQYGDLEMLHLLLEHGADPNALDDQKRTALCLAAPGGFFEVAEVLLSLGVDPNIPTGEKPLSTALHVAVDSCHLEFVQTLLEWSVGQCGQVTPLHLAARRGHLPVANLLVDYGAEANSVDENGDTPLHWAAFYGYVNVLQLLVDHGAYVGARNGVQATSLHDFVSVGCLGTAEKLLEQGADPHAPDERGASPLTWAVFHGHMGMVKLLWDKANPNVRHKGGWSLIDTAVGGGHVDVVEYLLQNGSSLCCPSNDDGRSSLEIAAQMNHPRMVAFLLSHDVDVNAQGHDGWTALHFAACENNQEMAAMLLDRMGKIDAKTMTGLTPFHVAIEIGSREVAEYLLTRGANSAIKSRNNWTPLHTAANHGHSKLVPFLLQHGADPHARSLNLKAIPLHFAIWSKSYETTKALCEHGDVSQFSRETNWGLSALQIAAENKLADVVEMLLQHGADPTFGGSTKMTPLYLAASSGDEDVVRILLHSEADLSDLRGSHWNPLHMAAYEGHNAILEMLAKEHQFTSFAVDCEGRSALHLAARGGNVNNFNILLEVGFDLSVRDYRNRTALHYAAASSSIAMVERIFQLPCGRDMLHGDNGLSILHWACISGDSQLLQIIISTGLSERSAVIDFPNPQTPWTPWGIAVSYNNQKLLLDA